MIKLDNRCANCGGKFGLVYHHHWGLRFCRKACKDNFVAKTAKDKARVKLSGSESEPHVPQRAFCPYFVQSCQMLSRFLNLINGCSDEQSKGEEA